MSTNICSDNKDKMKKLIEQAIKGCSSIDIDINYNKNTIQIDAIPDEKQQFKMPLYTSDASNELKIYDNCSLLERNIEDNVKYTTCSADGKKFAIVYEVKNTKQADIYYPRTEVFIYNSSTNKFSCKAISTYKNIGKDFSIENIAYSPDGNKLAFVYANLRTYKSTVVIYLNDILTKINEITFSFGVDCIAFSSDGNKIAVGGRNFKHISSHVIKTTRKVEIRNLEKKNFFGGYEKIYEFNDISTNNGIVTCIVFSPNGDRLIHYLDKNVMCII